MAWYRGGSVAVTNGSTAVVGTGTIFSSQVKEGDIFFVGANKQDMYEIAAVVDDTHLTLHDPFAGTTATAAAYAIIQNFTNTPTAELTSEYAALLAATVKRNAEFQTWLTGTATGGPSSNGYYPLTDMDGNTSLVPCPALIVVPVATPTVTVTNVNTGLFPLAQDNPAGSAYSIDLKTKCVHNVVLDQPTCDMSFINANSDPDYAQHFSLVLVQSTGSNKVNWPASVRWNQNRLPILSVTAGQRDVVDFFSIDAGATWMGFFGGQAVPQ